MDWELKARLIGNDLRVAGVQLLVCAAVIAYLTDSWWGYAFAAYVALSAAGAMSEKIHT